MPADGAKRLEDEKTLSSYAGIESGSMLLLLILPPFELYVQGADGRMHTITVPSSEPEVGLELCVYTFELVCAVCSFSMWSNTSHHVLMSVLFPSCVQRYEVGSLLELVRDKVHRNFTDYQLQFQNRPLQAVRHGKTLTLRDYRIKKGETLFIMKHGFSLDITNPKVCVHVYVLEFISYILTGP